MFDRVSYLHPTPECSTLMIKTQLLVCQCLDLGLMVVDEARESRQTIGSMNLSPRESHCSCFCARLVPHNRKISFRNCFLNKVVRS